MRIEDIAEQLAAKQHEEQRQQREKVRASQINPTQRYTRSDVEQAMRAISGAKMGARYICGWKIAAEEPGWFQVDVTFVDQYNMREQEYWYFYRVIAQQVEEEAAIEAIAQ